MGNYVSCSCAASGKTLHGGTRVILPSGEIRKLHEPAKAAELMLETPNHFLADAKCLQIGRRFSPLSADEELELGRLYAFFPMKRVNSVVNASDVGPISMAAKRSRSPSSSSSLGGVRVQPDSEDPRVGDVEGGGGSEEPKLRLGCEFADVPEFVHRRSSFCRLKKPLLETIVEEPILIR